MRGIFLATQTSNISRSVPSKDPSLPHAEVRRQSEEGLARVSACPPLPVLMISTPLCFETSRLPILGPYVLDHSSFHKMAAEHITSWAFIPSHQMCTSPFISSSCTSPLSHKSSVYSTEPPRNQSAISKSFTFPI